MYIVWALQYVTLTRPNITFCANKACQFMASPLTTYWVIVKWVIRYLSGTINFSLTKFLSNDLHKFSLLAYSDNDQTSDAIIRGIPLVNVSSLDLTRSRGVLRSNGLWPCKVKRSNIVCWHIPLHSFYGLSHSSLNFVFLPFFPSWQVTT